MAGASMAAQFVRDITPRMPRGVWIIYDEGTGAKPRYIARQFFCGSELALDANNSVAGDSLDKVRELLPEGLMKLGCHEDDPANVVETWA